MSSAEWCWRTQRRVASRSADTHRVIRDIVREMQNRGWSADETFGVHLALEEAIVNAIKHGNNSDSSKRVHLTCRLAPDRLVLEIKDEGPGFDPECVPDCTLPENLLRPSGRGLMLMRAYMSRVEFNAAGNCVTMEKIRSQAKPRDAASG